MDKSKTIQTKGKTERRSFMKSLLSIAAGSTVLSGLSKTFAKTPTQPKQRIWSPRLDSDPFLGEIAIVPYTMGVPTGWLPCNGQSLPTTGYAALYSLIGTTFGGNGTSTFNLPDLRGRVIVGVGQGTGLSNYNLGNSGGVETVTLTSNQIPSHSHTLGTSSNVGTSDTPSGNFIAKNSEGIKQFGTSTNASLGAATIGATGGGQSHTNLQPYLALRYIIAVEGIYPSWSKNETGEE